MLSFKLIVFFRKLLNCFFNYFITNLFHHKCSN